MDSWEGKENTKKGAECRFHRDGGLLARGRVLISD